MPLFDFYLDLISEKEMEKSASAMSKVRSTIDFVKRLKNRKKLALKSEKGMSGEPFSNYFDEILAQNPFQNKRIKRLRKEYKDMGMDISKIKNNEFLRVLDVTLPLHHKAIEDRRVLQGLLTDRKIKKTVANQLKKDKETVKTIGKNLAISATSAAGGVGAYRELSKKKDK